MSSTVIPLVPFFKLRKALEAVNVDAVHLQMRWAYEALDIYALVSRSVFSRWAQVVVFLNAVFKAGGKEVQAAGLEIAKIVSAIVFGAPASTQDNREVLAGTPCPRSLDSEFDACAVP